MESPHDGRIPHTCSYCQEELILPKSYTDPSEEEKYSTTFKFKTSSSKAQEAAANGCAFWKWFTRGLLDDDSKRESPLENSGISFEFAFNGNNDKTGPQQYPFPLYGVNASRHHDNGVSVGKGRSENGTLKILADEGDPAYKFVVPSPRATPVQSEENFALARQWMEDCQKTHFRCGQPEVGVAPTRLLEINPDTVRLKSTAPGEGLQWAALSYCWGGPQPVQTTTGTLMEGMEDIPIPLLPRTIQDAITTTREIGLRYLWIDCLCIIQDDTDDVGKEISLMPEIYRNATVTISAARANTSNEGFLHDVIRPTPQDISFRLRFLCPDGQIGSLIFYGQDEIFPYRDPIESRAWTLQEHLLSKRLLVFGSRQIWWSCRDVHTNTSFTYFKINSEVLEIRLRFLNLYVTQYRRHMASLTGQTWLSLVQHYTDRSVTFSHDKLLAISGIAEYYAGEMNDKYFAGHFKSAFPSSLLWKRHSSILPRPAEYRVPSWSWAAIDGQVRFEAYRNPISEHLELISCDIDLVSVDAPYGAVSSGTLTIRGRIRQVLWSEARDMLIDPSSTAGKLHTFLAETIPDTTTGHSTSITNSNPNANLSPSFKSSSTPVYCLEICAHTSATLPEWCLPGDEDVEFDQRRPIERSGWPSGLLLEKASSKTQSPSHSQAGDVFTRVGLFAFRDVEDMPIGEEKKKDVLFREEVEKEKRGFFEGCEVSTVRII